MRRHITGITLLTILLLLGGCSGGGGYVLRAKAVDSFISDLMVVGPSDANLAEEGIAGVEVRIWRDPNTLGRKMVAKGRTRPDGSLELPLGVFGAGWMKEIWMIQAIRVGYETAESQLALPRKKDDKVLLIMLRKGQSFKPMDASDRDMDDFERFR